MRTNSFFSRGLGFIGPAWFVGAKVVIYDGKAGRGLREGVIFGMDSLRGYYNRLWKEGWADF